MSSAKDFTVAIVGGGMCGLACALGLVKAGIPVDLFESAPKFDEVGAGVGLGPNAIRALEGLGILEAVLSRSDQPTPTLRPFRFLTGFGEHINIYDYPVSLNDLGLGIYRPAFLEALLPLVDPSITHFNKRCTGISTTNAGRHVLHFSDGTTHEADMVVGADGIKSVTRNSVVGGNDRLVFTNTVAYRGLVPTETLRDAGVKTDLALRPICWVGKDKHIITFPIQGKKYINIVAFVTRRREPPMSPQLPAPWVETVPEQELLHEFDGWGDDAILILKYMKNPSKWSIHALNPPLTSYVHHKIALVGDAAHGMLPHLGAGVGQGFEDVFALCSLLGHPLTTASNLQNVLDTYNNIRVPRANMVLQRSAEMGEIYEGYGAGGDTIEGIQRRLTGMWEPVWHHDLAGEVESAIKGLARL